MDAVCFLIAALAAIAVAIPFQLAARRVRPAGERMVEEARQAGRMARGVLVQSTFLRGDVRDSRRRNRQNQWMAVYRYEVDGVPYTYRELTASEPVEELRLYYPAGRPEAALSQGRAPGRFGGAYVLRVLLPIAVWAAVYWLLQRVW